MPSTLFGISSASMGGKKVTRVQVDSWLRGIADRLRSIRHGPRGEVVARIGLLEQHVEHLRSYLELPPPG